MDFTRFRGHYLLHDRGTPEVVERLAAIMATRVHTDDDFFKLPQPPYEFKEDASALESYRWLSSYLLPETPCNSVLFGIGLGGLLAAKLQEDYPAKRLSVVAVNAPLYEGSISLSSLVSNRVAIYSSAYTPIAGRCDWGRYAGQAYDVPWLQHGIKNTKYGLAYLLTAYMQIENLAYEVASFTDPAPEIPKAQGAVGSL
jgi:alpha-beta hydrolase superfamily lysophospholipase